MDKKDFPAQWIITRDKDVCFGLDSRYTLTPDYTLHYDQRLKLERMPIDSGYLIVLGAFVETEEFETINESNFLSWINSCVGYYCVVRVFVDSISIYTDPAGLMNVFYDNKCVSSCLSFFSQEIDFKIKNSFNLKNDWFTGDVTPLENVKYLLANHCLSVPDWTVIRFWPVYNNSKNNVDWNEGIKLCAEHIRKVVELVNNKYDCVSSLTGGRDSRVILAASEAVGSKFFTLIGGGVSSDDIKIVKQLFKVGRFDHQFVSVVAPRDEDLKIYDELSAGYSLGARRSIVSSLIGFTNKGLVHINGNLGAIGKCYYWPIGNVDFFDDRRLLSDFTSISSDKIKGLGVWLDSLPQGLKVTDKCNLMYLEQRGGRWMGVGEGASSMIYTSFTPFSSRVLVDILSKFPENDLREKDWHRDITRELTPRYQNIRYSRSTHLITRMLPNKIVQLLKSLKSLV